MKLQLNACRLKSACITNHTRRILCLRHLNLSLSIDSRRICKQQQLAQDPMGRTQHQHRLTPPIKLMLMTNTNLGGHASPKRIGRGRARQRKALSMTYTVRSRPPFSSKRTAHVISQSSMPSLASHLWQSLSFLRTRFLGLRPHIYQRICWFSLTNSLNNYTITTPARCSLRSHQLLSFLGTL